VNNTTNNRVEQRELQHYVSISKISKQNITVNTYNVLEVWKPGEWMGILMRWWGLDLLDFVLLRSRQGALAAERQLYSTDVLLSPGALPLAGLGR